MADLQPQPINPAMAPDRPGGITPPELYTPPPGEQPPPTPPIATQPAVGAGQPQDFSKYESALRLEAAGQLDQTHQDALNRLRAANQIPQLPPFATDSPIYAATTQKYNLPPGALQALAHQESTHDPNAVGSSQMGNSVGLMQITQDTGKPYGLTDLNRTNPYLQVEIAGHILRDNLDRSGGNLDKALTLWNPDPNFAPSVRSRMANYAGPTPTPAPTAVPRKAPPSAPAPTGAPQPRRVGPAQAPPPIRPRTELIDTVPRNMPGAYSYHDESRQHGNSSTIMAIQWVADQWRQRHPGMDLPIGDVNAPGHLSHRNGVDVDIGIPRTDGVRGGGQTRWNDPAAITTAQQQELVNLWKSNPYAKVSVIGFDNPGVMGVHPWGKEGYGDHGNHMHVRFTGGAPSGSAAGAVVGQGLAESPPTATQTPAPPGFGTPAFQRAQESFRRRMEEGAPTPMDIPPVPADYGGVPGAIARGAHAISTTLAPINAAVEKYDPFRMVDKAFGAFGEALWPKVPGGTDIMSPETAGNISEWIPTAAAVAPLAPGLARAGGELVGTPAGLRRIAARGEAAVAERLAARRATLTAAQERAERAAASRAADIRTGQAALPGQARAAVTEAQTTAPDLLRRLPPEPQTPGDIRRRTNILANAPEGVGPYGEQQTVRRLRAQSVVKGNPRGPITLADVPPNVTAGRATAHDTQVALDRYNELVARADSAQNPHDAQGYLREAVTLVRSHFPGIQNQALDTLERATTHLDTLESLRTTAQGASRRLGRAAAAVAPTPAEVATSQALRERAAAGGSAPWRTAKFGGRVARRAAIGTLSAAGLMGLARMVFYH